MRIKWTAAQSQTRAGELFPGETYEINKELGDEFVRRGLAESFTSSRPVVKKTSTDEEKDK